MNSDSGSQGYAQWPLNPSAYQNTANDQVDWAALAQQWIIMKEAGPPALNQVATAPSHHRAVDKQLKQSLIEAGEAPMDVEYDKDDSGAPPSWNEGGTSNENSWSWNQQQEQWNWANNWIPPTGVPPPGPPPIKTALLPTPAPYSQYTTTSSANDSSTVTTENYGYTSVPNDYSGGYWTASGAAKLKPHNKRYSKVNISRPTPPPVIIPSEPVTLDANKRKQLPAWIREGLEKMERDKLKIMEKEREKAERELKIEKTVVDQNEALEIIRSTVKQKETKSRFESEDEISDGEIDGEVIAGEVPKEDVMVRVRRTMTEILLKVTTKLIMELCKEELQRHLRKRKASDHRVSAPSGTNITNKLGLGAYEDMESSSEKESDDNESDHVKNYDSDAELRSTIKRKKAEFSRTERLIEEKLLAAEKDKDENIDVNNDSQVDANGQGKRRESSTDSSCSDEKTNKKSRRNNANSDSGSESSRSKTPEKKQLDRQMSRESEKEKRRRREFSKSPEQKRNKRRDSKSLERKRRDSKSSERRHRNSKDRRRRDSKSSEKRRRESKSPERRRRDSRSVERRRKELTKSPDRKRRDSRSSQRERHNRRRKGSRSSDSTEKSRRIRKNSKRSHSKSSSSRSRSRSRSKDRKRYRKYSGRSEERRSRRSRSRSYNKSKKRSSVSKSSRYHKSRTRSRSRGKRSERR